MVLDIIAVIISFVAVLFSLLQFFIEKNRNRKEATIHAFDKLEENENVVKLFSLSKAHIDSLVERKQHKDALIEEEWSKLSNALPLIEHFAVGINAKIYDIEVLNQMAGNQMIFTFHACNKLILYKRAGEGKENNYIEFETMVNSLVKLRSIGNKAFCEKNNRKRRKHFNQ